MSLRKSTALTAAGFEAHRRNAQKSTGPRTTRGAEQAAHAVFSGLADLFREAEIEVVCENRQTRVRAESRKKKGGANIDDQTRNITENKGLEI